MKRRLGFVSVGVFSAALMLSACSGSGSDTPTDTWVDSGSSSVPIENSDDGVIAPVAPEPGFGDVEVTNEDSGETVTVPNESAERAAERAETERLAAEEESRKSTEVDPQFRPSTPSAPSVPGVPGVGQVSATEVGQAAGVAKSLWVALSQEAAALRAGQKIDLARWGAFLSDNGVKSMSQLVSPTDTITSINAARALSATSTCVATWTIDGEKLGKPDRGQFGECFFTRKESLPTFKVDGVSSAGPNAVSLRVSTVRPVAWLTGQTSSLFSSSVWVVKKDKSSNSWLVDSVSAVNGGVRF